MIDLPKSPDLKPSRMLRKKHGHVFLIPCWYCDHIIFGRVPIQPVRWKPATFLQVVCKWNSGCLREFTPRNCKFFEMSPYWAPLHTSYVLTISFRLCSQVASQEQPRLKTRTSRTLLGNVISRPSVIEYKPTSKLSILQGYGVLTKKTLGFIKRVKSR